MKTIGASEAKIHFSALLKEIAEGGVVTITKHGRPVAKLVPVGDRQPMTPAEAIEGLIALRARLELKGSWKEFRDAGRRGARRQCTLPRADSKF